MKEKPILWVLEFENDVFDIHLFPNGEAFVTVDPLSRSQAVGDDPVEQIVNLSLKTLRAEPHGKYIQGRYPLTIPARVAKKMREVVKIKSGPANMAAREPVDGALMPIFVSEVVPRMRRKNEN